MEEFLVAVLRSVVVNLIEIPFVFLAVALLRHFNFFENLELPRPTWPQTLGLAILISIGPNSGAL